MLQAFPPPGSSVAAVDFVALILHVHDTAGMLSQKISTVFFSGLLSGGDRSGFSVLLPRLRDSSNTIRAIILLAAMKFGGISTIMETMVRWLVSSGLQNLHSASVPTSVSPAFRTCVEQAASDMLSSFAHPQLVPKT